MNIHALPARQVLPEFHTDAPVNAEEVAIAFEAFLPIACGDKVAAAVLAIGAVLATSLGQHQVR